MIKLIIDSALKVKNTLGTGFPEFPHIGITPYTI